MKSLPSERMLLDAVDRRLLAELDRDSRRPTSELARLVGMSAPAVTERLRRLEAAGVLKGFTVEVDPQALGYGIRAMVWIRPLPGKLHVVEQLIQHCPEVVECLKITGDNPFLAQIVARSVAQMDEVLERLCDHAVTSTAVIKSEAVKRRLPPLD